MALRERSDDMIATTSSLRTAHITPLVIGLCVAVGLGSACDDGAGDGEADTDSAADAADSGDGDDEVGSDASTSEGASEDASGSGESGSVDSTGDDGGEFIFNTCPEENKVGSLRINLEADYTAINGKVLNRVNVAEVPKVLLEAGGCKLMNYDAPECDPACSTQNEICTSMGCVPYPEGQDLGIITIDGLADEVALEARPPGNTYTNSGTLTHPAFAPGDVIGMSAEGNVVEGFRLRGRGVDHVALESEEFLINSGSPLDVRWQPGVTPGSVMTHIEVNIDHHGGSSAGGWIECQVADDGEHTIDASLIDRLLEFGVSGFPTITIARRSSDAKDIQLGCVEFIVTADKIMPVIVDGVVSCSEDEECDDGICLATLICGCTGNGDCQSGTCTDGKCE